jgi:hypothetical protein
MFEDSALRLLIYDEIVRTGETPAVAMLAGLVSAPLDDVRSSLRRMHDAHMMVLQPTGEILETELKPGRTVRGSQPPLR